jgi:hypothetical protein
MPPFPPVGHFDHQSIVGTYEPTLATLDARHLRNGLGVQVCYLYGGWQEESGAVYFFERKFIGPMTAGLWLMRMQDGGVTIDPDSVRTVRGEVKRTIGRSEVVWQGQMMEKQAAAIGEHEMVLRFTEGALDWSEGAILRVTCTQRGPGLQVYAPDPVEPFHYASQLYQAQGQVRGADVEGFVFVDHGAWPHGADWKENRVFNHLQLGWAAFANEYEDGSLELGHLCLGADRFSFMMVADADGPVALHTTDVTGGIDIGDNEWAQRALWRGGDDAYLFQIGEGGRLVEFTEARWGGYRAQIGCTRRVGDPRPLRLGFSWLETFAQRIENNGVAGVDDALAPCRR